MKELKLKVSGMVCGGCENRVKTALSEINGVESVDANHNTWNSNYNFKRGYRC